MEPMHPLVRAVVWLCLILSSWLLLIGIVVACIEVAKVVFEWSP